MKCDNCNKNIDNDDIIQCPSCLKKFHSKCIEKRRVEFETISGQQKEGLTYFFHCPECGEKFLNNLR